MINLVVTDLDKTLFDDRGDVSLRNMEAIKILKQKGIGFGVASGRAVPKIVKIMERLELLEYIDVIIGYNGVLINDQKVLEDPTVNFLDENIIHEVYESFKHHPVSFIVHEENHIICSRKTEFSELEGKLNQYEIRIEDDFKSAVTKKFPKLMLVGPSESFLNLLEDMKAHAKKIGYSFFMSHDFFLEIVRPEVSKGKILEQYCKKYNIDMKTVLCIGDNHNDYEMIKRCGYGIAMENAVPEIKAIASWVTTSNNEDGVAVAIEKFAIGAD